MPLILHCALLAFLVLPALRATAQTDAPDDDLPPPGAGLPPGAETSGDRLEAYRGFLERLRGGNRVEEIVEGRAYTTEEVDRPLIDFLTVKQTFLNRTYSLEQVYEKIGQDRAESQRERRRHLLYVAAARRAGLERVIRPQEVEDHLRRIKSEVQEEGGDYLQVLGRRLRQADITLDEARAAVREQLLRDLYQGLALGEQGLGLIPQHPIAHRVVVTPADLRAYYRAHEAALREGDTFEVRPIRLDREPAESRAAFEQRARELHARARAGESFAALRRRYSRDPEREGATPQIQTRGGWDPDFVRAVEAAGAGEISALVFFPGDAANPDSYFFFEVVRRQLNTLGDAALQERLRAELAAQQLEQAAFQVEVEHLIGGTIIDPANRAGLGVKAAILREYKEFRRRQR